MTAAATAGISLASGTEAVAGVGPSTAVAPAVAHPTTTACSCGYEEKPFEITYKTWRVTGGWGFGYNSADNHLRGEGSIEGNSTSIHLEINPLRLGDRNSVLAEAVGHTTNGYVGLVLETPAVDCHYPNGVYIANMYFSIRWPDGVLTSNQSTGQWELSATDACTTA
jgi:hypothetical protein